jgi:hypothetical protein
LTVAQIRPCFSCTDRQLLSHIVPGFQLFFLMPQNGESFLNVSWLDRAIVKTTYAHNVLELVWTGQEILGSVEAAWRGAVARNSRFCVSAT